MAADSTDRRPPRARARVLGLVCGAALAAGGLAEVWMGVTLAARGDVFSVVALIPFLAVAASGLDLVVLAVRGRRWRDWAVAAGLPSDGHVLRANLALWRSQRSTDAGSAAPKPPSS